MKEKAAQAGGLITEEGKPKGLNFDKMVAFVEGKARARRELDMLDNLDNIGDLVKDAVSKPVVGGRSDTQRGPGAGPSGKAIPSTTIDELAKAIEQLKLASIKYI